MTKRRRPLKGHLHHWAEDAGSPIDSKGSGWGTHRGLKGFITVARGAQGCTPAKGFLVNSHQDLLGPPRFGIQENSEEDGYKLCCI